MKISFSPIRFCNNHLFRAENPTGYPHSRISESGFELGVVNFILTYCFPTKNQTL